MKKIKNTIMVQMKWVYIFHNITTLTRLIGQQIGSRLTLANGMTSI